MMAEVDETAAILTADPAAPFDIPWQHVLTTALAAAIIDLDSAEVIRKGLGGIDDAVTPELLRTAAESLVDEASTLNVEQLYRRARQLRDDLDAEGIARREKERRDQQYFWTKLRPDGMLAFGGLVADEGAALIKSLYDKATHPRRGGPRFVDPDEKKRAEAIMNDPRAPGQIAVDALIAVLQVGIDADTKAIVGRKRPAVRVVVSERALKARAERELNDRGGDHGSTEGHGYIEGLDDPISMATVERFLCSTGTVGVKFDDDGQCVNVGRDQRLFTERQRIGLAIRDGGCRIGNCDRPPDWCEAHHIDYWHRDDGRTNIADGILLCRNHHMLLHNNNWRIVRDGGTYWLIPPPEVDATQTPRLMGSKSAAMHEWELAT